MPKIAKKLVKVKSEQSSVTWSDSMVEALLKSILVTNKDLFLGSKRNQDTAKAWNRVVLDVNLASDCSITETSAKNKFNYLKATYRTYSAELEVTGNPDEKERPAGQLLSFTGWFVRNFSW
jgi:hypothetical protein